MLVNNQSPQNIADAISEGISELPHIKGQKNNSSTIIQNEDRRDASMSQGIILNKDASVKRLRRRENY